VYSIELELNSSKKEKEDLIRELANIRVSQGLRFGASKSLSHRITRCPVLIAFEKNYDAPNNRLRS
jgi:alpha-L-fucosidase